MRLDKYLKVSRLIKRRTVANEACDSGRVLINDKPAKASANVKEGDIITITFGNKEVKVEVLDVQETVRKEEAKELGWTAKKDNLGEVMPGCSIGGDKFQNREKQLPTKKGRTYYECDINAVDGKRSDERVVYSNDGLIFYTPDAHESFIQLY